MTMITVQEQQDVLSPILKVSGITTVFDEYPDALNDRDLPALMYSTEPFTSDQKEGGANSLHIRWSWVAHLFVMEADTEREFQAWAAVKPFLTLIPVTLAARPVLYLADRRAFELSLHQARHEGPVPLKYNGVDYTGARFRWFTTTSDDIEPVGTI